MMVGIWKLFELNWRLPDDDDDDEDVDIVVSDVVL